MKSQFLWAGNKLLARVASIRRVGKGLSNRKELVTLNNGDTYTISQLDRDYYEVNGPHLTNCRVEGWLDGRRLINQI